MNTLPGDRSYAEEMDRLDPLADFAGRFFHPVRPDGTPATYLCGNSLGLLPRSTRRHIDGVLSAWGARGVDAHFQGPDSWLDYHRGVNDDMAHLVGALPGEVVVMNALTVNLHLLLTSFYNPTPSRYRILMETRPFPSDRYAVQAHLALRTEDRRDALGFFEPRAGEETVRTEDMLEVLAREGSAVALVLLGGVQYVTGQWFDIPAIAAAAQREGCLVGLDLAHAAGNVPLALHDWGVDWAVWCSYKYLNAGPGAPAGCFVHARHGTGGDVPRLTGWWGEEPSTRFRMEPSFVPAPGAAGWQISNPPVVGLASIRASLDLFREAEMSRLREKSMLLTGYLETLLTQSCGDRITVLTPDDPRRRGAQLSIAVARQARHVFEGLLARGIVCDWREPGVIRMAPVPLYNTFCEVHDTARVFASLVNQTA